MVMGEMLRPCTPTNEEHVFRAWKVFFLLPRWLLWAPPAKDNKPPNIAAIVRQQLVAFHAGRWQILHHQSEPHHKDHNLSSPEEASKIEQDNRHRRAEALASLRELSRATRTLNSDAAVVAVGEPEFAAIQALHPVSG